MKDDDVRGHVEGFRCLAQNHRIENQSGKPIK